MSFALTKQTYQSVTSHFDLIFDSQAFTDNFKILWTSDTNRKYF